MTIDARAELPSLPPKWDPSPAEKAWYRNRSDGGLLGWIVRRNGKDMIQLNRPGRDPLPFNVHDWIPEREPAILNASQAARISFEAHKAFAHAIGEYQIAQRDWSKMTDAGRIAWMKNGPKNDTYRHADVAIKIHAAIMALLEPMTR